MARARAALLFFLILAFIVIAASHSLAPDEIMEIEGRKMRGSRENFEAKDAAVKRRAMLPPPAPRANNDAPDPPASSKPMP